MSSTIAVRFIARTLHLNQATRRDFLKTSAVAATAAATAPFWFAAGENPAKAFQGPNNRHVLGCIGTGSRWEGDDGPRAMKFADCVAICDVDTGHAGKGRDIAEKIQSKKGRHSKPDIYGDYRRVLDRKDIDVVTIVTPDHWHTKIAIEAMKAGKDVYCEKPLTLTIDEGKQIIKVLDETKRVFQVGTQQRSEMHLQLLEGRRHGPRRADRQGEAGPLRHRRRPDEPAARPRAGRRGQLGHVARTGPDGRLHARKRQHGGKNLETRATTSFAGGTSTRAER